MTLALQGPERVAGSGGLPDAHRTARQRGRQKNAQVKRLEKGDKRAVQRVSERSTRQRRGENNLDSERHTPRASRGFLSFVLLERTASLLQARVDWKV